MLRYLFLSVLLSSSTFSFSQDPDSGTIIEPYPEAPIEQFYGEKLSIALHRIDGVSEKHDPTDYLLFKRNGSFEQSISGKKTKSHWSYNKDDNSISLHFNLIITFTIKETQAKKLILFNDVDLLRLYIYEENKEVPTLATPLKKN